MTALPQTQCPHCQAPVNYFAPGCFNCRQQIQWPAPTTPEQAQMARAANDIFQQQWSSQQPQAAAAPAAPPPGPPPAAGGDLGGLLEATRFETSAYNPQTAEDVEGLLPQSYREMMPAQVPVSTMEGFEVTTAAQVGAGLGITGLAPQDGFETTRMDVGDTGPVAAPEGLDRGKYDDTTRAVAAPVGAEPELERTEIADERRPARVRNARRRDDDEVRRICRDCGNVSTRQQCPVCGAPTKEIPAA